MSVTGRSAASTARAISIARALTAGSIRSGSSISQAVSPAGRMRVFMHRSACGGLERRQQLLVNVLESPVRHDDDEIAAPGVFRDGLDDVVDFRDVPRVLAAVAQIGDELLG